MTVTPQKIAVIGAGINGLVAANYLQRAGHQVTLLERSDRVGGACVSATATIDGTNQNYALGASTLGLMQDFVWQETGLAERLQIWAPDHPDLVFFPGQQQPTRVFADASELARELSDQWGERGDVKAFLTDEARVVRFLQAGYRAGRPPTVVDAQPPSWGQSWPHSGSPAVRRICWTTTSPLNAPRCSGAWMFRKAARFPSTSHTPPSSCR